MNCLIVAGGNVDKEQLKEVYKQSDHPFVIGADRGCITLLECDIPIDRAIGDFDSVSPAERKYIEKIAETEILIPEKDDTDTEHALLFAITQKPEKIVLMGATGTRLDHTLSNIGLLKRAFDAGINAVILDKNNRIRVLRGEISLDREDSFGKYISIIPFGEFASNVSIRGFKYEAEDLDIYFEKSRCVSNERLNPDSNSISNKINDGEVIKSEDYIIILETTD